MQFLSDSNKQQGGFLINFEWRHQAVDDADTAASPHVPSPPQMPFIALTVVAVCVVLCCVVCCIVVGRKRGCQVPSCCTCCRARPPPHDGFGTLVDQGDSGAEMAVGVNVTRTTNSVVGLSDDAQI